MKSKKSICWVLDTTWIEALFAVLKDSVQWFSRTSFWILFCPSPPSFMLWKLDSSYSDEKWLLASFFSKFVSDSISDSSNQHQLLLPTSGLSNQQKQLGVFSWKQWQSEEKRWICLLFSVFLFSGYILFDSSSPRMLLLMMEFLLGHKQLLVFMPHIHPWVS